jgi:hypothetical protein
MPRVAALTDSTAGVPEDDESQQDGTLLIALEVLRTGNHRRESCAVATQRAWHPPRRRLARRIPEAHNELVDQGATSSAYT